MIAKVDSRVDKAGCLLGLRSDTLRSGRLQRMRIRIRGG
jgi:hypothetical protein